MPNPKRDLEFEWLLSLASTLEGLQKSRTAQRQCEFWITARGSLKLGLRFPINSELLLPKLLDPLPWEQPNPLLNSVSTPRHQRTS